MSILSGGLAWRGAADCLTAETLTSWTIAISAAALIAMPLTSLLRLALTGDAGLWPHLVAYVLPHAAMETALLLLGVGMIAALAGIIPAFLVARFEFPGRRVLEWLLPLPLAIPTYIAAYVYVDLLDAAGPVQSALRTAFGFRTGAEYWFPQVRSLPGAILIFGFVLYPYVYLSARALFKTQSASFADAAYTFGATHGQIFRFIALPLARPAIAVGLSLALLETLNDIGAAEYLGVQTLTLSIFTTWLNRGSLGGAAQIALTLLVVVTLLIVLEHYGRSHQSIESDVPDGAVARRWPLTGAARWHAMVSCITPVAFGFVIPAAYLAREAMRRAVAGGIEASLVTALTTTVTLAAVATAVIMAIGIAATVPLRLVPFRAARPLLALASLGYAVPGTVLALGLLSPLVTGDAIINRLTASSIGVPVGLVLAGSSITLIIAYAARFAAIPIGVVQAALTQTPREFDESARLEGAGARVLLHRLHLPLMTPALSGAALLVFVDCLKELPMTLLLRPLNAETLATSIYQSATRGSFEDGAPAALLIVAAGIPAIALLMRLPDTRR